MRCPKCQYISYASETRCPHCGFDVSLVDAEAAPDLNLRPENEPVGPLADLTLHAPEAPHDAPAADTISRDLESAPLRGPATPSTPMTRSEPRPAPRMDLPLFDSNAAPSATRAPLGTQVPPPSTPLSVRRATPEVPRARPPAPPRISVPERQLDFAERVLEPPPPVPQIEVESPPAVVFETKPDRELASLVRRLAAGVFDFLVLAGVDATVIWLTLNLTGLTREEMGMLPLVPLAAFLVLLSGGYFSIFTAASGQTLGKMLAGVRVQSDSGGRVPLGNALVRWAVMLVGVLAVGVGLLPALAGTERRTLHDRIAGTRVVRA